MGEMVDDRYKGDNSAGGFGILLGVLICCAPASCGAQSSTITIDAATAVAQSDSGDDLATLQNIFQDANAPNDGLTLDLIKPLLADLKMKRIRLLQSDVFCDLDQNGQFGSVSTDANGNLGPVVPGNCYPLAWQLQMAFNNGLSPHMAVAAYAPPSFARQGPAETWSSDTLARYKLYANKLVSYIVRKTFDGGGKSVVFEVSNEMDIADPSPVNWNPTDPSVYTLLPLGPWGRFLWWIDPATYTLNQWPPLQAQYYPYSTPGLSYPYSNDIRRLDHGISPVQKIFADAVNDIRTAPDFSQTYPGMTIEMAGPAFSSASFGYNPGHGIPTLEEDFLDHMLNPNSIGGTTINTAQFNSSLDHFSFHFYGDFQNGWSSDAAAKPYTTLGYLSNTIRNKLAALGHPEVTLFVSEWGPSATTDTTTDVNYSHKGAAWAAAFLTEAVADKLAMGSFLVVEDATANQPGSLGLASLTHKVITESGPVYYPKPVANVFKMFAKMTGTRRLATVSTTGVSSHLGVFAATDAASAGIVVFNYNSALVFGNNANSLPDTAEAFSVEVDNLPFNGTVTVQRYLVDANTSNLNAFLNNTDHPDPSLQMVEQFSAQVQDGKLILPLRSLGLGVTFWRIAS